MNITTDRDFANPHFAEPRWLWLAVLGPLVLVALQRYSGLGAAAATRRRSPRRSSSQN